ncbi:MAG: zinc ribbon domain-containing protein [Euryarchaeota archaeon]|nr:zinc ribbon domain-containing protein [Euryarchaeota archaeon]
MSQDSPVVPSVPGQNLTRCPDCGKDVSKTAQSCPNCGRVLRTVEINFKVPKGFRWGAAVGGGLIVLVFASFHATYLSATWLPIVVAVPAGYWIGKSKFRAWPRMWLICTVLSFLVPLSATVFGARQVADASDESGGAALGVAAGAGLGIIFIGFIFFFVGIVFAIVTYFATKGAKEKEERCRAAGVDI